MHQVRQQAPSIGQAGSVEFLEKRVYPGRGGVRNIRSCRFPRMESSKYIKREDAKYHFECMRRMQKRSGTLVHRNESNLKFTGCIVVVRRRLVVNDLDVLDWSRPTRAALPVLVSLFSFASSSLHLPQLSTTSSLITSFFITPRSSHQRFARHLRPISIRASRNHPHRRRVLLPPVLISLSRRIASRVIRSPPPTRNHVCR